MSLHDMLCVALYEAKQQSRRVEFHLFIFFSLVGIMACHVYWLVDSDNWKILTLPCAFPLVNAYLFNVVQSLFAILFMTDFPRRERLQGALESILSHPINNSAYVGGKVIGNMILFGMVNAVVIASCLLFVHLGSIAPYQFGYYLFYFFTLNIPSLVFIMGISLWLIRLLRVRFLAIILLLVFLSLSVVWLPFRWHGTFDFLGSGLPNLFSDIIGHVDLTNYLLHRLGYFLLGLGFMLWSIQGMKRIPNSLLRIKMWRGIGICFILMAVVCGVCIEIGYLPARKARAAFRDSFRDYWSETCGSVTRHDIIVQQEGERLSAESELTLHNPNKEKLEKLVLFLNPGLHVESLKLDGEKISFHRENQVIIIDQSLEPKDSVHVHLCYRGIIDERLTDLQLCDSAYEDSFRCDQFFPTGRRSAFVGNVFLLLTPACVWYPVAIPPVNPIVPVYSGRDFTRFKLSVVQPHQKILCSQGMATRKGDTCFFQPSRSLAGVSLCGGDYELQERRTPDLSIRLYTFKKHFTPFRHLPFVNGRTIQSCLKKEMDYRETPYRWSDRDWYEEKTGNLFLMEVPLPFITEAWTGKERTGLVEPGMVFLSERAFDIGLKYEFKKKWNDENVDMMFAQILDELDTYNAIRSSHPILGIGNPNYRRYLNTCNVYSLLEEPDLWIKSEEFPFVGFLFNRICLDRKEFSRVSFFHISFFNKSDDKVNLCLANNSLFSIIHDSQIESDILHGIFLRKTRELLDRFLQFVSWDVFYSALIDVYSSYHGIVSMDSFARMMNERLGIELDWNGILRDWLHTEHDQYFKVKDLYEYYYPATRRGIEIAAGMYGKIGWVEIQGQVKNCGKTGGVVAVEFTNGGFVEEEQGHYTCYLEPGEAKAFRLVCESSRGFVTTILNTGLSANNPQVFYFERRDRKEDKALESLVGTWSDIDTSVFLLPAGEIVADNADTGFSLKNARETWFQKWFKREPEVRNISGTIPTRWTPSIDPIFHGDSVRSAYFKGFGDGNSTATWRVNLNERAKYRISAKVSRYPIAAGDRNPKGIVYRYTIKYAGKEEQVAVELDSSFEPRQLYGWVTLGEFDLPQGEVSVTLSDFDEFKREYIAVVADAIKLQKLDE